MPFLAAVCWVCAAVALRLLLVTLGAGEALLWQPEVSTPANTLLKTREGLQLLQWGTSPFEGASCNAPPLWLTATAPWAQHPVLYVIPNIVCDLVAAAALYLGSAVLYSGTKAGSPQQYKRDAPWLTPAQLGALYLFNPFVILTCVAGVLTAAENAAVLLAFAGGCLRNGPLAGAGLAAGAYLGLHPLLLLVPVLLLMWQGPEDVLQHVGVLPSHQLAAATNEANGSSLGQLEGSTTGAHAAAGASGKQKQQQVRLRHARGTQSCQDQQQRGQQEPGITALSEAALLEHQRQHQQQQHQQQQQQRLTGPPLWCLGTLLGCTVAFVLLSDRVLLQHPSSQCLPVLQQWLVRAVAGGQDQSGSKQQQQQQQQQVARCWAGRVYGFSLLLQDLTPNIGLWWYFFTEVFTEFRLFFLFVFNSFPVALVLPVSLRFSGRPVFVLWVMLFIICMFKPYECVGDMVPWTALLPLLQQQLQSMKLRMFLLNSFVLLLVLGPAMWHQWITADSANANFFYSITLLLGVWCTVFLMQLLRLTCLLERCLAGKGPAPRLVGAVEPHLKSKQV